MPIKMTVTATGRLVRGPKGSGPLGGRKVIEDTGRTLIGVAHDIANEVANDKDTLDNMAAIYKEEVLKVVPVQYGGLKDSIRSEITQGEKGSQVRVLAGGPDAPVKDTPNTRGKGYVDYAVVVHEEKIPYLYVGFANAKEGMQKELAKGVKKVLGNKK